LLQNGSFEQALVRRQNIPAWSEQPFEGAILRARGLQVDGEFNAYIGPGFRMAQTAAFPAGQSALLTFWAGTGNPRYNETVRLQFLNVAGELIDEQIAQIDHNAVNDTTPPRLLQYTLSATAPAGTVSVRVLVRNDGRGVFALDATCLR
jgi:hypothetical protein